MNKIFKDRSILLFIICLVEIAFCFCILIYFNHLDHLTYQQSRTDAASLALLVQNMFTSTWWGLIILTFALICIFSLTAFIYRDLKFQFLSICLYVVLFMLSLNFEDTFMNNFSNFLIFVPLVAVNIVAYFKQKKISHAA